MASPAAGVMGCWAPRGSGKPSSKLPEPLPTPKSAINLIATGSSGRGRPRLQRVNCSPQPLREAPLHPPTPGQLGARSGLQRRRGLPKGQPGWAAADSQGRTVAEASKRATPRQSRRGQSLLGDDAPGPELRSRPTRDSVRPGRVPWGPWAAPRGRTRWRWRWGDPRAGQAAASSAPPTGPRGPPGGPRPRPRPSAAWLRPEAAQRGESRRQGAVMGAAGAQSPRAGARPRGAPGLRRCMSARTCPERRHDGAQVPLGSRSGPRSQPVLSGLLTPPPSKSSPRLLLPTSRASRGAHTWMIRQPPGAPTARGGDGAETPTDPCLCSLPPLPRTRPAPTASPKVHLILGTVKTAACLPALPPS